MDTTLVAMFSRPRMNETTQDCSKESHHLKKVQLLRRPHGHAV